MKTRTGYRSRRETRYPRRDTTSGFKVGVGIAFGFLLAGFLLICLIFLPLALRSC